MHKQIQLTKGQFATVDDSDFEYLNQFKWHLVEKTHKFYAYRRDYSLNKTKGIMISMHRVIMNAKPGTIIDHINQDGLDNRKENLKFVSKSQNAFNSGIKSHNTNGFKGIEKSGTKWRASIKIDGIRFRSDNFVSKEEAAQAYNKLAKLVYEHAHLNIINNTGGMK
jgi:hypothetical protein